MSNPLFSVGEKVILVSSIRPELNGVYFIKDRLVRGDAFVCEHTGKTFSTRNINTRNVYLLHGVIVNGAQASTNETSLRKYHEPSTDSFEQLMQNLKNPVDNKIFNI